MSFHSTSLAISIYQEAYADIAENTDTTCTSNVTNAIKSQETTVQKNIRVIRGFLNQLQINTNFSQIIILLNLVESV